MIVRPLLMRKPTFDCNRIFYRLRKRDRRGAGEKSDGEMRKGLLDRTPAQTITIVTKGSETQMGSELKAAVIGLGRVAMWSRKLENAKNQGAIRWGTP